MSVASKNLFELLGNDAEDDTPQVPVKTVEKTTMRSTKRNVEPEAPSRAAANTGARRNNASGNEAAFRDRGAGSDRNRGKTTEEPARGGPRGGYGARVRGGRGGRFPRERDDRHTKGPASGSEKQAAQSWGATEGDAERKDEQAGEAIAQAEQKDAEAEAAAPEEPAEPEEKHISYTDYLAQQAEKKLALDAGLETRKPNEGTKLKKEWTEAKEVTREEEDFMIGTGGKTKRERERKTKQLIDIDQRYVEPERPRGGARGGRGGPRGGARGGERGGAPRGAPRGGAPRGGAPRGGRREGAAAPINTKDESAFPSLGGK
ncbi:elicitor protein [Colletotrichum musicola]|uniref:Elicitor protein n=1 Tax=Colletotrichum musicola TaxID=2175873 RepID=A0A8H6K7U2_9PEZI|nr:elicitor protein [Colletotrichum musicola]